MTPKSVHVTVLSRVISGEYIAHAKVFRFSQDEFIWDVLPPQRLICHYQRKKEMFPCDQRKKKGFQRPEICRWNNFRSHHCYFLFRSFPASFNGISTFIGYLMSKPSFQKYSRSTIQPIAGRIMMPFPRVYVRK